MFSPYQLPYIIQFFEGIDKVVSNMFSSEIKPNESELTFEFLNLMGTKGWSQGKLRFDITDLQELINDKGDMLHVSLKLHPHKGVLESRATKADFGLILKYENNAFPDQESWIAAYLIQAKSLYSDSKPGERVLYSRRSKFKGIKRNQEEFIQVVAEILGPSAYKYCLFMPKTRKYKPKSTGVIRA